MTNREIVKKTDGIISLIIGFLVGVFFLIILNTISKETDNVFLIATFNFFLKFKTGFVLLFSFFAFATMIVASAIGKKIITIYQITKSLFVSVLNTFIDLGFLNLLIWLTALSTGVYYLIFKGFSFLMATTNSYFWNKHWTFEKKKSVFNPKEIVKFFEVTLIKLSINMLTASIVVNIIGPQHGIGEKTWATIGAFVAVIPSFVWSFTASKFIVFKK